MLRSAGRFRLCVAVRDAMVPVMDADALEQRYARVMALLRSDRPVNDLFVGPETEEIARAGHAGAAALMATLAASGFGCAQDWRAALDWLALAAERGDAAAQAQLQLLSGGQGRDWRDLVAAIDVAAWIAPRPHHLVIERPRIGIAEAFIDPSLCAWLIERGRPLQSGARVYSAVTGQGVANDRRSNSEATFGLAELDLPLLLLRQRIANTIGVPVAHCERTSVFRYQTGQTFAPHADYLDPGSAQLAEEIARRGQRIATFLIYLNDGFEGGETHFLELGRRLRGKPGDAIYFYNVDETGAPDPMTRHEGAPPTSGEKWLLSQFIRERPQLAG